MNEFLNAELNPNHQLVDRLQGDILEEIYKALRVPRSRIIRDVVRSTLSRPTHNFCMFIAAIDALVKQYGFRKAAQIALEKLSEGACSIGEESIPEKGPLLVASNHPGTYDGFAIVSRLPRNDTKIIVSGIPFFRNLPNAGYHLIFTSRDTHDRMNVIRKAIRHLQEGGSLLIFPSGRIDPDPSVFPNAENDLTRWSRSVEVFLKKVPHTKLILAMTSGVLSKDFIHHPLGMFFKKDSHERRRVMEFMQVIKQMVKDQPVNLRPKVSFAEPILARELIANSNQSPDQFIKIRAGNLLNQHLKHFYSPETG